MTTSTDRYARNRHRQFARIQMSVHCPSLQLPLDTQRGIGDGSFNAFPWADVYSDRRQRGALHKNLLNQESSCATEIPAQKVGTMQPLSAFAISGLILHYSTVTKRPARRRVYTQGISDEQTKSINPTFRK